MALVHIRSHNKNLLALGHLSGGREDYKRACPYRKGMKIAEWIKENAEGPKKQILPSYFCLE